MEKENTKPAGPATALDQYNSAYKISVVEQHSSEVKRVVEYAAKEEAVKYAGFLKQGLQKLEELRDAYEAIRPDREEIQNENGEVVQAGGYTKSKAQERTKALKKVTDLNKLVDTCLNIKDDAPFSQLEGAYKALCKNLNIKFK